MGMSSPSAFLINVSDVVIPPDRYREANGDMEGLCQSILRYGLLQPIILDQDNRLIAGLRRLTAHQMNGASQIIAMRQDEIDEVTHKEMELEENIQRHAMTWVEEQKAIAEIDRLKNLRDPTWNQTKTAVVAGGNTQQRDVSQAIKLAKAIELFPEITGMKSKAQAINWLKQKASNIIRMKEVKDNPLVYQDIGEKILLGDSVEMIKKLPDEFVHAVITDPPFGIDFDEQRSGTSATITAYEDDASKYVRLLSMANDLYRIIKPNGWLIWFFGVSWIEQVKDTFRRAGFGVDEVPIVWNRSAGKCFTTHPDHLFSKGYDLAIHAWKGNPQLKDRSKVNVLNIAPLTQSEKELLVERPVELYEELINRLTIPGERVADFFVGSGSCMAAAAKLKRDFIGVEINPERRAKAITKIKAYMPDE